MKSSVWGTTAKSHIWKPGHRLRTPWCTPPLNPCTLHLLFLLLTYLRVTGTHKKLSQLWMQGMGRGSNTISSILSPYFTYLELLYTNPSAL